ncbi:MAG: hypothetical protein AB7U73_22435 [Pirellulales bacterium]
MTILDEKQRRQILAFVGLGCSQVTAARMANCSLADVQETLEQDPELLEQVVQAAGELEGRALQAIEAAWEKNWRAACWLLERLYPERYARRPPNSVLAEDARTFLSEVALLVEQHVAAGPEREKLLSALRERGRELHAPDRRKKK